MSSTTQKRAPKQTSNLRFITNDGQMATAGPYVFPAGKLSPRQDLHSLYAKLYPLHEPLSPDFEIFRGQQARYLPPGIYIWERYTISEIAALTQRTVEQAKKSEAIVAFFKKQERRFWVRISKKRRDAVAAGLKSVEGENKLTAALLVEMKTFLLDAHKEKLALLRQQKKPNLP